MDSCGAQPPSPAGEADRGGVLAACLLLFLAHGDRDEAELAGLVTAFGLTRHRSALPATLRTLHRDELIAADGHPADDGASPREYRLTDGGRRWLARRGDELDETQRLVARFLHRYPREAGETG